MKSHRISHGRERTQPNAVSATTPWGRPSPPLPLPLSLLLHLSLALSYANTRNIFQMLFAFALHTIFAWRARCVPAFSHFSIFHVRFVVVADDTTHIHTLTHTHTVWHTHTHMLHTTLVFEALCCLHFHYFFYVIFSFLLFFLRAAQQFSPPAKRKLSSIACPAVLPLLPWRQIPLCLRRCCCYFPPSVCILNYPWANGLCVCVCVAALRCLAPTSCWAPSPRLLISSLTWLLGFVFLSSFCICQLATPTLTVLCRN